MVPLIICHPIFVFILLLFQMCGGLGPLQNATSSTSLGIRKTTYLNSIGVLQVRASEDTYRWVSGESTVPAPPGGRLRPYCWESREISSFIHFLNQNMKRLKQLTLLSTVTSLLLMAGCSDND